jgi:hypothetical protein
MTLLYRPSEKLLDPAFGLPLKCGYHITYWENCKCARKNRSIMSIGAVSEIEGNGIGKYGES